MEAILFMFCLTLHNVEEALWFIDWRLKNMPNSKRIPRKEHFLFSVLGITILGYMAAALFILFPDNIYFEYVFIGFVGAMCINAIVPHLLLTIVTRTYCPGVLTGCLLLLPIHCFIIMNALHDNLAVMEVVAAIAVVGLLLIGLIPVFTWLAKKCLPVYVTKEDDGEKYH